MARVLFGKKAFTLIELLIVVAIIGILAAIAVPNFLNAQQKAKLTKMYGNMKSIQTAIAAYQIDYQWAPIDQGPDAETGSTYIALTTPTPYLSSIEPFRDPYFTNTEEDVGMFMAYGGALHVGRFDDAARIAMFQDAGVSFFLFDWGPDRAPNVPWPQLAAMLRSLHSASIDPSLDGGVFYNPTNGFLSTGDIMATQSRILQ